MSFLASFASDCLLLRTSSMARFSCATSSAAAVTIVVAAGGLAPPCPVDELAVVARLAPSIPSAAAGNTGVEVVENGEVKICPPAAAIGVAATEAGATARAVSEAGLVRGMGTFLRANEGLVAGFDAVRVSFAGFGADLETFLDAVLALSFACVWDGPFEAFENGAATPGWLRATMPATANGQMLFGRVRKSNGLFLVWRESAGF
jgi:hypothetical protein